MRQFPHVLPGGQPAKQRKSSPRLILGLLISAMLLLTNGCTSLTSKPIPMERPIRPQLTSLKATSDGGIIMDKRDAAELLIYIEALERAAVK